MASSRLFEILNLLLARGTLTAKQLAEHFEVSTRTIYRDVDQLSQAGIPIYTSQGKGGGIALLPGYVLDRTILSEGEQLSILAAIQAVDVLSPEPSDTALTKLAALFGTPQDDWLEVDFSDWGNGQEEAMIFIALKEAILRKHRVSFYYHGATHSAQRVVEPLKLCFKGQSWYLYAHCTLRDEPRFFKLRRIQDLTPLPEIFGRVAPARVFTDDPAIDTPTLCAKLRLSPSVAYRVRDEFSTYTTLPDGRFEVTLEVPPGDWLYQYLATFGAHCEILSPPSLREEMRRRLEENLKVYSK
ncbi:helix-turn-helix transcriptional regulator [Eubacterium barkeri]|uniref:Predicted DNA-binding transcriptional regulator YafY, contains an HTH and WYL domains n=1 Tax=Eubacterium barkeri TaxID=1528 RepID=A0A1H3I5X0_EUBBA|nr:YafY family protein [Eubacterium barkeri]SDY23090.1 Predicted DNA-binding transcriptional regulator YafY, contains an HTH and WYL domains [Eubacterium barkeri]